VANSAIAFFTCSSTIKHGAGVGERREREERSNAKMIRVDNFKLYGMFCSDELSFACQRPASLMDASKAASDKIKDFNKI